MPIFLLHPTAGPLLSTAFDRARGRLEKDGAVLWPSLCFGGEATKGAWEFTDEAAALATKQKAQRHHMSVTHDGVSDAHLAAGLASEAEVVRSLVLPPGPRRTTPLAAHAWAELQMRASALVAKWAAAIVQWLDSAEFTTTATQTELEWMALPIDRGSPYPLLAKVEQFQRQLILGIQGRHQVRWPEDLSPIYHFAEKVLIERLLRRRNRLE